jgi:hypothetical protein
MTERSQLEGGFGSGSGSRNMNRKTHWSGSNPKIEKNLQLKKKFFIKNYNLPIPGPPKRTFKQQEKPAALKREHAAAVQNMKFLKKINFCGSF